MYEDAMIMAEEIQKIAGVILANNLKTLFVVSTAPNFRPCKMSALNMSPLTPISMRVV